MEAEDRFEYVRRRLEYAFSGMPFGISDELREILFSDLAYALIERLRILQEIQEREDS